MITPIKLRFGPFDFSKDFTVGSTFGVRYTKSDFASVSFSGLLGIGVSGVTLDSFSTNGKVRNSQETLAFTPSLGVMLEFGNAQVGVFTGIDMLSGSNPKLQFGYAPPSSSCCPLYKILRKSFMKFGLRGRS